MSSVVRVAVVLASLLGAGTGAAVEAQGRPSGEGRIWAELGLAGSQQARRCLTCTPSAIGGPSVSAAGGVTLRRGFGIAVLGRAFQELSFESSLSSSYLMALAQYAPAPVPLITLNAGAGWARHSGYDASGAPSNGSGAALYVGTALRLPSRSTFAITLVADIVQSFAGSPSSHPRLFSVGLGLGAAGSSPHPP